MPESGAGLLRHLDAVAGVAEIDRIDRLRFEILSFMASSFSYPPQARMTPLPALIRKRLTVLLGDQPDNSPRAS